ncbi:phosphotransferase [Streptomyces sp. NBC_00989]|uniref:phosphotransferase n=1 Tax=Streptomyces sp. NBC_00989 TaxID=2903705 RepID=UPI00386F91FB|nr:aminoglycoside phosphotransferase family protein [Streptomyces sp. NBC_00989]
MISTGVPSSAADSLEQIPPGVREELKLRRALTLGGGGTPAHVYLCEDEDAKAVVVKVLRAGAGVVDGHDLGSFLRKPAQISRIHRELPYLSPYYVPLVGQWRGPGWGAYAMPRIDGVSPTMLLHDGDQGRRRFLATLRSVFAVLGTHGYAADVVPAPPGHGFGTHMDRLSRRLPLLQQHLGPLVGDTELRVNGRRVPSVRELLRRVASRPDVLAAIEPARLYYPVHGDLNLGNLIIRTEEGPGSGVDPIPGPRFTVLDPRGIEEYWDPVYDAAKALFSLTLFDAAIGGGFEISQDSSLSHEIRLRRPLPAYGSAAVDLPAMLMTVEFFRELSRSDPLWPRRLLYTHTFHVLSEAACRLSDRTDREFPGASGWAARRELALGLYLSGLLLLDNLLSGPDDPESDPAAHLDCLATINGWATASSSPQ